MTPPTTARPKRTRQPCPGCGRETGWRQMGAICGSCEADIRRGREAAARDEAALAAGADELRYIPTRAEDLHGYWHGGRYTVSQDPLTDLRAAMWHASHVVGRPDLSASWRHADRLFYAGDYGRGSVQRLYRPEVAEALTALDTAVRAAVKASYQEGVRDGAMLLEQLAEGRLTVAQLNERTMREPG